MGNNLDYLNMNAAKIFFLSFFFFILCHFHLSWNETDWVSECLHYFSFFFCVDFILAFVQRSFAKMSIPHLFVVVMELFHFRIWFRSLGILQNTLILKRISPVHVTDTNSSFLYVLTVLVASHHFAIVTILLLWCCWCYAQMYFGHDKFVCVCVCVKKRSVFSFFLFFSSFSFLFLSSAARLCSVLRNAMLCVCECVSVCYDGFGCPLSNVA